MSDMMNVIGKRAEIMRQWRIDHPNATIDEVMAHYDSLWPGESPLDDITRLGEKEHDNSS